MVEDSRQEPVEAERTGRARRARAFVARGLWLFLVLLWLAYGVCVGGVNPALSAVALPPVLAAYYIRYRRAGLTNRTQCPAWWAGYGLLAAIPVGLVLSSAIQMEYVRDYHAYLMLGKSLYADGTYVDYRGEVAWRPPGTSLLYALPSLVGIRDQSSICAINSGVFVIIFLCIKKFIGRDATADLWFAVVPAATVICLATSYLLFLPIAHLPPLALMLLALVLVPTRARPLADFPPSGWLLVGILTGISSLFRANLVLECPILLAALVAASGSLPAGPRLRKMGLAAVTISVGFAAVVAPWTVRNWYVLHQFVPISTNGGFVFYSGNGSPKARDQGTVADYLYEELYRDFDDEVERDRAGWRRGIANIVAHPGTYLESFVYRVPRLLGRQTSTVEYVEQNGRGSDNWKALLVVPKVAWLMLFWGIWVQSFLCRRSIRDQLQDEGRSPWREFSILVGVVLSLHFEGAPNYQLSYLAFVLAIWLDRRGAATRQHPSPPGTNVGNAAAGAG